MFGLDDAKNFSVGDITFLEHDVTFSISGDDLSFGEVD